jgi:hypothetical protein
MNLQRTANDMMTKALALSTKAVTTKTSEDDPGSERGLQAVDTGGVLPSSFPLTKDMTQDAAKGKAAETALLGLNKAAVVDVISEGKVAIEPLGSVVTKM